MILLNINIEKMTVDKMGGVVLRCMQVRRATVRSHPSWAHSYNDVIVRCPL
jgi:hypothetical protein